MVYVLPDDVPLDLIEGHVGTITAHRPAQKGHSSHLLMFADAEAGRFFVKGQRSGYKNRLSSLEREGAINPYVQPLAPELLWRFEDDAWHVLVFKFVEGHHASFLQNSTDLPLITSAVNRVAEITPPDIAAEWTETRWDEYTDDPALFRGDVLLYTDINQDNILIGDADIHLVDWAWPTVGAGFIDPALLVIQLISAGHSAGAAERAVAGCKQWQLADQHALDAFSVANVRMWHDRTDRCPEQSWRAGYRDACVAWADHRGVNA